MAKAHPDFGESVEPARGLIRVDPRVDHLRHAAPEGARHLVAHLWEVGWRLDPGRTAGSEQQTLPHPSVHVVFEAGRVEVVGVMSRQFRRVLTGSGHVFGIKFRPGAFAALRSDSVQSLTDRRLPASEILELPEALVGASEIEGRSAAIEGWLGAVSIPEPIRRTRDIAEAIAADPHFVRVDQVAAHFDVPEHSLQRAFARYVGVSPKWVILRYRVHELLARIDGNQSPDWAGLAAELGYSDQAHLIHHFRREVGVTPGEYWRGSGR